MARRGRVSIPSTAKRTRSVCAASANGEPRAASRKGCRVVRLAKTEKHDRIYRYGVVRAASIVANFRECRVPMFYALVVVFIILPVAECLLLWTLSDSMGLFNVIFLVVGTGLIGVLLARREGDACWRELHARLDRGEPPTEKIVEGILILLAGLLLVTPGLITDILGILLLIPPIRKSMMWLAVQRFLAHRQAMRSHATAAATSDNTTDEVIDVE